MAKTEEEDEAKAPTTFLSLPAELRTHIYKLSGEAYSKTFCRCIFTDSLLFYLQAACLSSSAVTAMAPSAATMTI